MQSIAVDAIRLRKTLFPVSYKPTWCLARTWSGVARIPTCIHADRGLTGIKLAESLLRACAET